MSWTIAAEHATQDLGVDPEALAMQIDPRTRTITLGIHPLGATSQEADSGAVLIRYLAGSHADWTPIIAWLGSPEAAELLHLIEQGHTAEQLWSGDWQARWTEAAWNAAGVLHSQVAEILAGRK